MKKFYAFSLMALATVAMSASGNVAFVKQASLVGGPELSTKIRTVAEVAHPSRVAAKAASYDSETWNNLGVGKYVASALASCYGGTTDAVDVTIFEAEGKKGLYKVEGVWPDLIDGGVLYVDATDPDFVLVPSQFTGIVDNVDGDTYIESLSAYAVDVYGYTKEAFLAGFSEYNAYVENGIIHFPIGSLGLQWPFAPDDSKYGTEPDELYDFQESEGLVILPGVEYVDPWSEPVDATMIDNLIGPSFGKVDATPYTVQIQYNSDLKKYRVLNPWSNFYKNVGFNGTSPTIEIEAVDPTDLVVGMTSIGVNGGATDGLYSILSQSYYVEVLSGKTLEDEYKVYLTKNTDGTSTITFPYKSMLLYAATSQQLYYTGQENTVSTITFKSFNTSGIESIAVDNSNAKVEYYNLQGVRINRAEPGQVVIKKKGTEVTKIVVR